VVEYIVTGATVAGVLMGLHPLKIDFYE